METSVSSAAPPIALVSMPWMSAGIPSIQLATLAASLDSDGIASELHELFLDYAACVGLGLYKAVSNAGGFVEEWLFAKHYFGAEIGNPLSEFRAHRPQIGLGRPPVEDVLLDALVSTTGKFLDDVAAREIWSRYDIVGFSLTISQTASSMALARSLKTRHPELKIIFGGAACAGAMGPAILRICPYVDAIVGGDGEPVVAALVHKLRRGESLDGIAGITWRPSPGEIVTNPDGRLLETRRPRPPLSFDGYFARLARLGLRDQVDVWLPFESSRGCWYGEKNQCTFCGLHEIMSYRSWTWESVLGELEAWEQRYGVRQFFSVDLIMPREYLSTFLPEVVRRGHEWSMFYAIKANMKRAEIETLAAGGVRWIQPGIESLDAATLKLMHKGVTPLQNIQLLKWCEELGIRVTWNIIIGIPGEPDSAYAEMAELSKALCHLPPPSGVAPFELHRFSPLFEHPDEFAIEWQGAYPLYQYIFPVPKRDLDDLVYRHDYRHLDPSHVPADPARLHEAVAAWYDARDRGASLTFAMRPDQTAEITDRRSPQSTSHTLSRGEAQLYQCMDAAISERTLVASFAVRFPAAMADCAAHGGIEPLLERWIRAGLVVKGDGKLLALAVNPAAANEHLQQRAANLRTPATHQDRGEAPPRRLPVVGQGQELTRELAQGDGRRG
jgi:ribosomal peptide maturation radical SAM protein 1